MIFNSNLNDVVEQNFLIRRLKREEKDFNNILYSFYYYYENSRLYLDIYFNKIKKYKISIHYDYPFRPPVIYLYFKEGKSVNYLDFLKKYSYINIINKEIKKYNIKCLCCKSLLCPGKWSPAIKIIKLLKECKNNCQIINSIFNKYWFLKHANKMCIPNEIIDLIFSFIFNFD